MGNENLSCKRLLCLFEQQRRGVLCAACDGKVREDEPVSAGCLRHAGRLLWGQVLRS